MKKKTGLIIASIMILGLCGCGNTTQLQGTNEAAMPESSQPEVAAQGAENSQQQNSSNGNPEQLPGVTVAVVDDKRANITIYANGGIYYGYSLALLDPAVEDADKGNHYSVVYEDLDGTGYTGKLMEAMHNYGSDEKMPDDIPYENLGNGDVLFHVTLPEDSATTFSTITEYNLSVCNSPGSSSFDVKANYPAAEISSFMDADAAESAKADFKENKALSQEDAERIIGILDGYVGGYQNADYKSFRLDGGSGTYQLTAISSEIENVEIHLYQVYADIDDQGDDYTEAIVSLENDNKVTVDLTGREGWSNEGKKERYVFENGTITLSFDDTTMTWTAADRK